jgi:hypothetical protein
MEMKLIRGDQKEKKKKDEKPGCIRKVELCEREVDIFQYLVFSP